MNDLIFTEMWYTIGGMVLSNQKFSLGIPCYCIHIRMKPTKLCVVHIPGPRHFPLAGWVSRHQNYTPWFHHLQQLEPNSLRRQRTQHPFGQLIQGNETLAFRNRVMLFYQLQDSLSGGLSNFFNIPRLSFLPFQK